MNDHPVILAGATAERMTKAAAIVAQAAPVTFVGGFAVSVELGRMHRATFDVDAVADEIAAVGSTAGALVASGIASPDPKGSPSRVYVCGEKIEIIDTSELPADTSDVDPPRARLFVLAHRWAFEAARPVRVCVAGTDLDELIPVAPAAALVATKLHALADRHDEKKKASDTTDLFQLLDQHDRRGAVADAIGAGPAGLGELVALHARELLLDGADRAVRYLKAYGEPTMRTLTAADVRAVAAPFAERLER